MCRKVVEGGDIFYVGAVKWIMADVDKHEIRTRVVLRDSEKQKYLLLRNEATGACMFPGETVRQGKTIEETAQRLFNQVRLITFL